MARTSCPTAERPGRLAAFEVADALRREIRRAFGDMAAQGERDAWRGYVVTTLFSLDPTIATSPDRRLVARYRQAGADLCGRRVAKRSWVVLIDFPNAAAALLGQGVAYLARSPNGWRIWYATIQSELFRT